MSDSRESRPLEVWGNISTSEELLPNNITQKEKEKENDGKKQQKRTIISKYLSYIVPLVLEVIIFIITFVIPKGVFETIEYSSDEKSFIIRRYDSENTIIKVNATQEELDIRGIIVPLDSFLNGIINEPISIPNTYKKLEGKNTNGLDIFSIFLFLLRVL